MNDKVTLQDIVNLLAQRQDITRKDAEIFVKTMFELIEEILEKDNFVKVKGLGVFKLIEVESRESVNVNTRERFKIQGHSKVSFTPDAAVRDLINKPFAHFEAVSLDEETVINNTVEVVDQEPVSENCEEDVDAENQEAEASPQILPETNVSTPNVVEDIEEKEIPSQTETMSAMENAATEEDTTSLSRENDVVQPSATKSESAEEETLSPKTNSIKERKGWYIAVILLIICAIVGYKLCKTDETGDKLPLVEPQKEISNDTLQQALPPVSSDTCALDSNAERPLNEAKSIEEERIPLVTNTPTAASDTDERSVKKNTEPSSPVSGGDYEIVGFLQNHTVGEGETLRKIALKYYGTKELSQYIVQYNKGVIKNPDNISVGTVLKIPKLQQK